MKTKIIPLCLGILLGGAYTAIILSVKPELPELPKHPEWCLFGEYSEKEWEALENKPDWVYIEFNGVNLVIHTKCPS